MSIVGLKLPGIAEKSLFAVMSGPDAGLAAIALSLGETIAATTTAKAMAMTTTVWFESNRMTLPPSFRAQIAAMVIETGTNAPSKLRNSYLGFLWAAYRMDPQLPTATCFKPN
jgi:hypothetical protein